MKTIQVPIEWFETLVRLKGKVVSENGTVNADDLNYLLGYLGSAEYLIKNV
jgi:hypothetical protein